MRTLISHGHKCIFVHIPKNAGVSVWLTLGEDRTKSQHLTLAEIKQEITPQIYSEYQKFAIIRNTYTRLCSLYAYYIVKHRMDERLGIKIKSFKQFVMCIGGIFDRTARDGWNLHKSIELTQSEWITVDGEVALDRILTFENINEEFLEYQKTFRKYKRPNSLKHENSTGVCLNRYMEEFDEEMLDKVSEYYKEDLERFGHEFKV